MDEHGHDGVHGAAPGQALEWVAFDVLVLLGLAVAAVGYAASVWASRDRGTWPVRRSVAWGAGLVCAGAGSLGPVAEAAHTSFTAHMLGHLLLGMLAPLLLVLGAPVTVLLRALPVGRARSVSRFLRRPTVRVLMHPVVAGVLNAGGLWLLYTSDLYPLMGASVLVHALVHAHLLVAGYLLTASVVGVDPAPHRASLPVRAAVLVVFIAAHSVLAKWLYAHPPPGVDPVDARVGAQLMYYGGDVVDVILLVLLFLGWYTATRVGEPSAPSAVADPGAPPTASDGAPLHPEG